MEPKLYALIALGGGLGSALRVFLVDKTKTWSEVFPVGVFMVNLIGSLAIGFLASLILARANIPETVRVFLILGFLGGFTTFSSYSYDSLVLLRSGLYSYAFIYMFVQLVGGVIMAALGFYLARLI